MSDYVSSYRQDPPPWWLNSRASTQEFLERNAAEHTPSAEPPPPDIRKRELTAAECELRKVKEMQEENELRLAIALEKWREEQNANA